MKSSFDRIMAGLQDALDIVTAMKPTDEEYDDQDCRPLKRELNDRDREFVERVKNAQKKPEKKED